MGMEIKKRFSDPVAILEITGRFDAYEIAPVNAWINEQTESGHIYLVCNLEGVNFIDSTALSTLVRGLKHCREKGGNLHLCCLQQPVRVIFELTRLDKAFDIFPLEEEACQAFLAQA